MVDEDGFQVVRKGRRLKYGNSKCKASISSAMLNENASCDENECDIKELMARTVKCRGELAGSKFFDNFKEALCSCPFVRTTHSTSYTITTNLEIQRNTIVDIVCYGIGKVASCPAARYQFALLLLLRELLQITGKCFIYEPNFSDVDLTLVKEFGCFPIEHNEEGKRRVEHATLFFMLHCGKPLYNSVLWANWGLELCNVVILGNSFTSYQERIASRMLAEEVPYINNIFPYIAESPVPNTFHLTDIFNDSAIHWFPSGLLSKVPKVLWNDNEEPKYSSDDPEIITKNVQS